MSYRNPVIPGFHPDPSVCRVGEDYYLATSSMEYFPGVPLFHSRDLAHWRPIGHCLTRRGQVDLEGQRASRGIYAPTLRHHDGLFYMITTHVTKGLFFVKAEDPAGEWSDPVWITDFEGPQGDPDLFFDDDGAVWLTTHTYRLTRLDLATGRCLDRPVQVWSGMGGGNEEAPHIYKINGMYTLLGAEGGTGLGHMAVAARATHITGPYEACPYNPILTHRHAAGNPIQATGHADLVQAHVGSWWAVFLGVREGGGMFPRWYHLGRETFLAPVTWTDDGWPLINGGRPVAEVMDVACLPEHPWPTPPARDGFDSAQPAHGWNFLRNPDPADWSLTDRRSWLRLSAAAATLSDLASPACLLRRQQHFDCRATTLMDFAPTRDGEEAGLTVRINEDHHYEIAVAQDKGERVVLVRRRIGSLEAVVARRPIAANPVELRVEADRLWYRFSFAKPGHAHAELARGETRYLSVGVAGGFTGVYFGVYATGNGERGEAMAWFDRFDYEPAAQE